MLSKLQGGGDFLAASFVDGEDTTSVVCQSMGIQLYSARADLVQHARDEGAESSNLHFDLAVCLSLSVEI